jgi:hypothetical protein
MATPDFLTADTAHKLNTPEHHHATALLTMSRIDGNSNVHRSA